MKFLIFIQFINLFQVLAIKVWSRVCAIDENFFARFIFLFNAGFSLITQFSRWLSGSLNGLEFAIYKGSYTDALSDTIIFWPIFTSILIIVLIVGGVTIIREKYYNQKELVSQVINISKFNNMAYNKPLLNTRHSFISMFIIASLFVVYCIVLLFSPHTYDATLDVIMQLFFYIVFPTSVMSTRICFAKFIFREIQNICI